MRDFDVMSNYSETFSFCLGVLNYLREIVCCWTWH